MKRRGGATVWILTAGILCFGTQAAVDAGTLEVLLRTVDGEPIHGESVILEQRRVWNSGRTYVVTGSHGVTDDSGRAVFENLPPGQYSPLFRGWSHRQWVSPMENPFVPPPSVRLTDPDDHVVLEVEVHPGVPVTVSVDPGESEDPRGFRPVFRNLETGYELTARVSRTGFVEKVLALGLWEVRVEPKPGFLLISAYRDRLPVTGSTIRLDLAAEPVPADLTWRYRALARLAGVVTFDGRRRPMWVEATLVEGGGWLEDAQERGGSQFRTVTDGPDDNGDYEMVLPDGVWRVRPRSREAITSEPEEILVAIGPGETGEADFHVQVASTPSLGVMVVSPDGTAVEGATVEAFPLGQDDEADAPPAATAVTDGYGNARLTGLDSGEGYRIVAGHEDYLEGETFLRDLDLEGLERSTARVVLRSGGTLEVREIDRPETSRTTLLVKVDYLDDPPDFRLHDPEVRKAKRLRQLALDRSGRATASGFLPGDHLVSISTPEVLAAATRALVRRPGEPWSRELRVRFWGEETLEIEVKRVPAARVHLELVCSDGWPLPSAAFVRVVRVGGLEPEPVLDREGLVLQGKHHDRLEVGPLDEGVYTLAVRPQGFERWTWLYGTTDPDRADPIVIHEHDVARGETVNLGGLGIECGPAVDLVPEIRGDAPLPPLEEIEVEARYLPLGEGGSKDPEQSRWRHARVTKRDGVVELRDFPRGTLRLRVTLTHPHFLPHPDPHWETEVELERGQYHRVHPRIEGLGGSIRVKGAGSFARLVPTQGKPEILPLVSGSARFDSLEPGRVDVELCSDETCESTRRRWSYIEVIPGQETVLGEGSASLP